MANLNSTLPANEARTNFYRMLDEAGKLRQFTIHHRGKPSVVVMSLEEFEGWQETLDIMSNKAFAREIKQGMAEARKNKLIKFKTT